ncbi:hypothetical protein [Glycomyces sp. YM15]|uniref:hypothetical protein n=1 Tax=Glycomyces sp. YM15 TaxID=2800446 RepID=UPI001966B3AB|nr:hypothetical protein [Glycomyces sp. YM15]
MNDEPSVITTVNSGLEDGRSLEPSLQLGPTAQMYGSLAAVLAGFAFTALVLYLGRQNRHSGAHDPRLRSGKYRHINPSSIVKTLFYAMCTLTICAFLYARLAGESVASGRVLLGMSLSAMVLAPAVLSLFYALNLVMVTHEVTRSSAEATRWVVAAAGPAVVIGLMADLLDTAWRSGCGGTCTPWLSPRWWCAWVALLFLVVGMLVTVPVIRRASRLGRPVRWLLRREPIQAAADLLLSRPHFPALISVSLALIIGVGTIWSGRMSAVDADAFDPRYWVHPVLVLTAMVMATFAFATGSILSPARTERPRRIRVGDRWLDFAVVTGMPRVRVVDVGTGQVLGTVVGFKAERPKLLKPWNAISALWLTDHPEDVEKAKETARSVLDRYQRRQAQAVDGERP